MKKICVVGAGYWGKNHIHTLNEMGYLQGIVDSNKNRLQQFSKKYPKVKTYISIQEAVKNDFDGFTVATPANTHHPITKFLLENHFPVLVEKPLAMSTEEARDLQNTADQLKVSLMVGHVLLFHPAIKKIKDLLNEGKLGKLQYLYSNRLNLGTVRTEENSLWSFAPHDISIFQFLIEMQPDEVISRGGAFLQSHVHDTTVTILTYPNNIVGHIFVSWLHPFKEHRLIVIGSKGMLSFEDSSSEKHLLFYEKGIDWIQGEPIKRDGPTEIIPYDASPPLTNELEYFVHHLEYGSINHSGATSGIEVLSILEFATKNLDDKQNNGKKSISSNYFVHQSVEIDDGVSIGSGTNIWHFSHVQSGATIGESCTIGQNVNIGNNVKIGNHVKIQNNVSVYEGVELEDYVFCGPSMVFTNVFKPRSEFPQRGSKYYAKTLVKKSVTIGANATILCGITIGEYAFIGAGSVVTRDVQPYALMIGNPAKQVGWVDEKGNRLEFDQNGQSRCGRFYIKDQDLFKR